MAPLTGGPYAKAVEQTLTLDYTASSLEGQKQFSLTVSQHQPKTCSTGQAPHAVRLHRAKATLCRKGGSTHKRWGPFRKGQWPQAQQKKTHPAFPLTRSENSRADDVSVPLVPYEATGNSPTPVESSSSPHHHTLARTHTLSHTRAPLPPCHRPWREMRREPWGADGGAAHPSQGNTTHHNAETCQQNDSLPLPAILKAPLPQQSHSISTRSGTPARC